MELDNDSNFNMIDIVFSSIDITKRMGLCNTIDLKRIDCNRKYSLETSYQSQN